MAISRVRIKVNGVWSNLTRNGSTGKWEGSVTAPANTSFNQTGGYYPVTVEATNSAGTVVTRDATDATVGQALRLTVRETIKPVITLVQPSNGAYISNNRMPVIFDVVDEAGGSGVKTSTMALKIGTVTYTDTSAGMARSAVTNGYRYTYTPQAALPDGAKSLTIDVQDNDGNAAAQIKASFTVDTTPPTLSVSYPQDGLETNNSSCIVQGVTNDVLSSPVSVRVQLGDSTYNTPVGTGGAFTQALTLSEGQNNIRVTSTDAAGKSSTVSLSVLLDTTVPTVRSVVFTPNPVNASASVLISLEVV